MKTKTFFAIMLGLALNFAPQTASAATTTLGGDPEVKVIVSQKRIWLVADEISVKNLTVQVLDERGKVVLEKQLSSKSADWSLRIEALPEGKYSVKVGSKKMADFKR